MPRQLLLLHNLQLQLKLKIKRTVPLTINGERLLLHHLSLPLHQVILVVLTRGLVKELLNQTASLRVLVDHGDHLALKIIVAAKNEQTYYKSYN